MPCWQLEFGTRSVQAMCWLSLLVNTADSLSRSDARHILLLQSVCTSQERRCIAEHNKRYTTERSTSIGIPYAPTEKL
jgi:hypothetical protein